VPNNDIDPVVWDPDARRYEVNPGEEFCFYPDNKHDGWITEVRVFSMFFTLRHIFFHPFEKRQRPLL
jgi:hypothetical protein